jgi:hypothetical protein
MALDPTAWPSPIHGWAHWYQKSNEYERTVYEIALGYYERHGHGRTTDIMMRSDDGYKVAIANQQFAERRAHTFGLGAIIRMLEASLAETERLNAAIEKLIGEGDR